MAAIWQQLSGMVWLVVGVALAATLISAWLRSATFKGWWGEYQVKRWLAQDLDAVHYHCVHNVTLQLKDASTTQIDHVVFSTHGIFVLETKHLQGWIFGGEKQTTWTQTIFQHRGSFQNPLRQNWRHIKALEEVLQVPLKHLHSVVVFTGDCTFKTPMPHNVFQGRDVVAWIAAQKQEVWLPHEVSAMVQTLAQQRLQANRATHQAHVAQLQERHAVPRQKVLPRNVPVVRKAPFLESRPALAPASMPTAPSAPHAACPSCGDTLVRRSLPDKEGSAQYFWRCTQFPLCRFMHTEAPVQGEAHTATIDR